MEESVMKKLITVVMVIALISSTMIGCGRKENNNTGAGGNNDTANTPKAGFELALITDVGTIDDKSFNQGSWEGLFQYAKENDKTYKYYQPAQATTASYLETITLAVRGGAKLIVCPGFKFAEAVYDAQTQFPDVRFIILDSQPEKYNDTTIMENVYAVYYAEQQAGFLAGYAAVKEGYTKLGFMGGMAVPAVVRFGYGYVLGAEAAAKELDIPSIEMKYHYTGGFAATPEVQTTAASWYQSGTEVIFGCGGAVGNSVMAAAQDANGKVIGVDVDQSSESETVITSAMKMLSGSVYDGIKKFYEGNFPGAQVVTLDIITNGVGLPMETSRFENFTQADYDEVYNKLSTGAYTLDIDVMSASDLPVTIVRIEEVK